MHRLASQPPAPAATRPPNSSSPRWLFVIAVALTVAAALALLAAAWFAWDRDAVLAWKESASPPVFFAAMALLPALGAPLTPFYIVAGATFGLWIGLAGSAAALTLNLSICYFVARRVPRDWLQRWSSRFGQQFPNFERDSGAVRFTMLVKLTPGVPAFLKNYLLGLSGVPFQVYLGTSFVTTALYAIPLMVLGQSLFQHDWSRSWIAVLLAAVVGVSVWIWRRKSSRA